MSRSPRDMRLKTKSGSSAYVPASAKEWDRGQGLQVRAGGGLFTEQGDEQMFAN